MNNVKHTKHFHKMYKRKKNEEMQYNKEVLSSLQIEIPN